MQSWIAARRTNLVEANAATLRLDRTRLLPVLRLVVDLARAARDGADAVVRAPVEVAQVAVAAAVVAAMLTPPRPILRTLRRRLIP